MKQSAAPTGSQTSQACRGEFRPGAIDLESAADELLFNCNCIGRAHGIYTQKQLDRKIRDEEARLPNLDKAGISSELVEYLCERQIDELIDTANLSSVQEIIYRLDVAGLSLITISATLEIKHQTIEVHLRRARRKVRAAYRQGRYAGWYEVYLSEVNRPAYRARGR